MNDYAKMLQELDTLDSRKRILLHSCCGPCSSYVITFLVKYFDITVYYYNPNIYPETEYLHRKNEQIRLINLLKNDYNIDYIDTEYDYKEYLNFVNVIPFNKEGDKHCYNCYLYRMDKTASVAVENGYDYFTTTLSVSPYKKSDYINEIGQSLEQKYGIKYLYSNFKKQDGYKKSIELSRKYDLYRQNYCGCVYSLQTQENKIE